MSCLWTAYLERDGRPRFWQLQLLQFLRLIVFNLLILENVMHNYSIIEQTKIEKAIILASSKFAICHDLIKPTLLHAIRVGSWLYFHGYETNIVIAGFLHDIIEDTDVTEQEYRRRFWCRGSKHSKSKHQKYKDSREENKER